MTPQERDLLITMAEVVADLGFKLRTDDMTIATLEEAVAALRKPSHPTPDMKPWGAPPSTGPRAEDP